jgi:tRNA nucleotidyltransferase (CCA-adding enzyme)
MNLHFETLFIQRWIHEKYIQEHLSDKNSLLLNNKLLAFVKANWLYGFKSD